MTKTTNATPKSVTPSEAVGEEYGSDYLNWKSWDKQEFGVLSGTEERYFSAEIQRVGMPINRGADVLEVGFGSGSFLAYAQKHHWNAWGTEVNMNLVELATEKGFNVRQTDSLSDFTDNSFDLVVAFDVLEHIPQTLLPQFLAEIKRVLKDNGIFIARFPNGDSPFGLRSQNGDLTHLTVIGSSKARQLAAKVNMDILFVGGEAMPIIGVSPAHFFHRIISWPIKQIVDLIVNLVFLPRARVAFCSQNITMICSVRKRPHQ